ncbi:M15 family metallopeptidase [Thermocoleostomius sinensis]|uniref:M15 family metallopeptidase n=1 Tax=Thermocoleostomius sinensis A174 TaxID=2016057 RepID=A0A9E9C7M7_9CYAN|nr:M15 family metallopeptidase [Thermocoleostomius sinensis]WAL59373.1 M15 family metallopeptidase [Thermocoleostomius sinensis A174]
MTLKPDSFQPASRKKINVWIKTPRRLHWVRLGIRGIRQALFCDFNGGQRRSWTTRTRLKVWHIGLVFWLGVLTAIVQSALLQIVSPDTAQRLHQATSEIVQVLEPTAWLPTPIDMPKAMAGLAQLEIRSYNANFAYLGHLPYDKPSADQLVPFPSEPPYMTRAGETLHQEAVAALKTMMTAAQQEGIFLFLVSGFRDLSTQHLLFQARTAALGSEAAAAKAVAPPGYSEHHTGYAIDLADGLNDFRDFEHTAAFAWMTTHAHEYGFELSFPPGNPQGVDYEPWHWRFVGSPTALDIFATAREKLGKNEFQTDN